MSDACKRSHFDERSIGDLLVGPSVSFALKGVIRNWSSRDCVDAARDTRVLCRLFERKADRRLGIAS